MARAAHDALPGYESRSSNTGGGRHGALRSDEAGPLFSDLVASSPRPRRRRLGLGVSSGVHALLAGILLLAPIPWPAPPPGHRDRVYALGGDIITAVDGRPVRGAGDVAWRLLEARPGEVLRLEVHRSGQTRAVLIPLEKMGMQF